jgi:hypothetical protein
MCLGNGYDDARWDVIASRRRLMMEDRDETRPRANFMCIPCLIPSFFSGFLGLVRLPRMASGLVACDYCLLQVLARIIAGWMVLSDTFLGVR